MATAEHPDEGGLEVLTPEEALRRARPLPARERLVVADVTAEDWLAFDAALSES